MIINIINNPNMYLSLSKYNRDINNKMKSYKFSGEYDFKNKVISPWFDPKNIRDLGLSRTYPHMSPVQYRKEYCLNIHCSNYLPLFLIDKLYTNRKNILIEDIGGGMGWLFFYLNKLGFNNFQLFDNFSQVSQEAAEDFINSFKLACHVTTPTTDPGTILDPVITNNVGVPSYLVRKMSPNLELAICYTNRELEKQAKDFFYKNNFKFLCKDSDDLSFSYCREDKYAEFNNILECYSIIN
jgi:hypothetical protein